VNAHAASPKGRRVAFVQEWAPQAATADTVIVLTPAAFEGARAAGAEATVLDDHVDRTAIFDLTAAYLRWQRAWYHSIDESIDAGGAAIASALYLTPTVSSVVIRSRLFRSVIERLEPDEVMYVGPSRGGTRDPRPLHNGHIQFWPTLGDAPLASRLLPLISRELGIHYDEQVMEPTLQRPAVQPALSGRFKTWLARQRNAWRGGEGTAGATLLLWGDGYGVRQLVRQPIIRRHRLYVLDRGNAVTRLLRAGPSGLRPATAPVPLAGDPRPVPADAYRLLDEVDEWSGIQGTGTVLRDRFEVFVGQLCPSIGSVASALLPALSDLDVERVVATNPSSIEEYGALLAASRLGQAERILAQHGDQLLPLDFWLIEELQNFDVVLTSDASVLEDLPQAASSLGVQPPKLLLESPRIETLRARQRTRRPRRRGQAVCYLPAFLMGDAVVPDGSFLDDAWYHRWHRRLLELFVSHPEVQFVWKALPGSDRAVDPMPHIIAAANAANVTYETAPFQRILDDFESVISDFPSTGLYEAAHAGKPLLAIVFSDFVRIRPAARRMFAPVIRDCSSEIEALNAVEAFLMTDHERWRVNAGEILPRVAFR
jgi:hypothetical protein